jgi:hypothetical protein
VGIVKSIVDGVNLLQLAPMLTSRERSALHAAQIAFLD